MTEVLILGADDHLLLRQVAPDVFDAAVRPGLVEEFLRDPRHHLAVAIDAGRVVGAASAVHYLHPDKDPELWINEVGVAEDYRRRGLGRHLLTALFALGRELGCREAWVLTERTNPEAIGLYRSLGGVEPAVETVMFSFSIEEPSGGEAP